MTIINAIGIFALLGYIGDIAFVIGGILAAKKIGLGSKQKMQEEAETFQKNF